MKVLIVGAGPAGLLLANYLTRLHSGQFQVHIVERGPDPRLMPHAVSYPVQLQARGLEALSPVQGLSERIVAQGIRPKGVAFHSAKKKKPMKIPLDPPRLFVDHHQLVCSLLDHLLDTKESVSSSLKIDFGCTVQDLNLETSTVSVQQQPTDSQSKISFDGLVAADGGKSTIRNCLVQKGKLSAEVTPILDQYRTLSLTSAANQDKDKEDTLDNDWLHAWMLPDNLRVMVSCLTNDNSSKAATNGAIVFDKDPFQTYKSPQELQNYLSEQLSPATISLEQATKLLEQPTNSLVQVYCQDRLHVGDKVLLLGDAAHAVSQSVGHGCVSSFQDVAVFDKVLQAYQNDWKKALPAYTEARLADAQALHALEDGTPKESKWLKAEWMLRQLLGKTPLSKVLRPLPVDLLTDTTLPYHQVLEQSQWWIDRVRKSKEKKMG